MSPTALLLLAADPLSSRRSTGRYREGVPGVWDEGGVGGVLYRVPTQPSPGSHITVILASGPYLRPNEGELQVIDEVSEIGSRLTSEWTQNDPRIDPRTDPPDWSPDGPRSLYPGPQIS